MTRAALTRCARLLGDQLSELGFEADRQVFRRYNATGDVVIVDLQSYASYSGETRFFSRRIRSWVLAEEGASAELRRPLFGAGWPDDETAHEVDRAVWEHARRADGDQTGTAPDQFAE